MTITALTTELEALNIMLTAADEDPVQTASQPGHLPLSLAKGVLSEVARAVQTKGWAFNTEYEFPLSRDIDGYIPLPANTLSFDVDDKFTDVSPVQRGLALYDRKNHTRVFQRDLTGTLIVLLSWDELPQALRQYIAIKAARTFQVRMQAGEFVYRYSAQEEQDALDACASFEADVADANFLTDSWSVASVLQYREQ